MTLNWRLICFPLMICLAQVPARAAEPKEPLAEASTKRKAAATAKPKPKVKPKATAKPKAAATKQKATPAKAKANPAKPLVAAAKPQTRRANAVRHESAAPAADLAAVDESNLDGEAVAARRAVTDNPGDARARERLARITVVLVDALLRAEAIGETGRSGELARKLGTDLHDTGWRVQKMAQSGDVMARQATGFLLERGVLLEKDENKSCAEFFMAAEQLASSGWHAAQCLMTRAPDQAWLQMERAAVRGHAIAQESMGRRCLGEFGATGSDYVCARSWLAQSASQGRSRSQTLLAYLLMNGHGGPVDEPRAARLYKMAAEQGDADAQNNLGEIHEMGHGTAPNPEEALRWYERAAERGLGSAQFNAGRLWAIGAGDKKDPARARALLVQAEGKGIAQARDVLNWLDRQIPPASAAVSDGTPEAATGVEKKD
jgi:TPR repeat protein